MCQLLSKFSKILVAIKTLILLIDHLLGLLGDR